MLHFQGSFSTHSSISTQLPPLCHRWSLGWALSFALPRSSTTYLFGKRQVNIPNDLLTLFFCSFAQYFHFYYVLTYFYLKFEFYLFAFRRKRQMSPNLRPIHPFWPGTKMAESISWTPHRKVPLLMEDFHKPL